MPDLAVTRPIARSPIHPGELMREILSDRLHLTASEAARRMRVAEPVLDAILDGAEPVSADLALRFARLTGGAPELYLHMQAQYDLWAARRRLEATLAEIEMVAPAD